MLLRSMSQSSDNPMSKYRQPDPLQALAAEYKSWEHYYRYGGRDPTWPDGSNMMLIRNHIIYYKQQIKKDYPQYLDSELYRRELPPEVDPDYMARADEIRAHAVKTLETYEADPYLQYLRYHRDELSPKEIHKSYIDAVMNYASGLKAAIQGDNLVPMRRHEFPNRYLESFRDCAARVKECLENAEPNLFSLVAAADESGFEFPDESDETDNQGMVQ